MTPQQDFESKCQKIIKRKKYIIVLLLITGITALAQSLWIGYQCAYPPPPVFLQTHHSTSESGDFS